MTIDSTNWWSVDLNVLIYIWIFYTDAHAYNIYILFIPL